MTVVLLALPALIYAAILAAFLIASRGPGAPTYAEPEAPAEGYFGCELCAFSASAGDGFLALHLRRDHPLERAA